MKLLVFIAAILSCSAAQAQYSYNYLYYPQQPVYTPRFSSHRTAEEIYSQGIRNIDAKEAFRKRQADLALEQEQDRLDRIEKWAYLKERQEAMRKRGYLPPLPKSSYYYKGVRYDSFAQFAQSPAYNEAVAEGDAAEAAYYQKKAEEKKRYDEAVEFDRNWRRMSYTERGAYENEQEVRRIMGEEWWQKNMK